MSGTAQEFSTKAAMRAVLAGEQKPRRHLTRRGLAALAAAPTLWWVIQKDLGNRAPYAAQGLGSCDPEQHLAALVYSRGTADLTDSPPTHIRLNATYFIPGHRQAELTLSREKLSTDTLESVVTDPGAAVRRPGRAAGIPLHPGWSAALRPVS